MNTCQPIFIQAKVSGNQKNKNITQQDIQTKTGLPQQSVSRIEKGRKNKARRCELY